MKDIKLPHPNPGEQFKITAAEPARISGLGMSPDHLRTGESATYVACGTKTCRGDYVDRWWERR